MRFSHCALIALAAALPSVASPEVTIDQVKVSFDQPPVIQEGRVLVPLRGVFETLGAEVTYDSATHSIRATRGDTQVSLALGSRQAQIDGRPAMLDVPASTIGGRTVVPLRFVSEALGATVDWHAASETVAITTPAPQASTPPEPVAILPRKLSIDSVIHSATGPLAVGDRLQVVMTGDSGGSASFDVMGVQTDIPMREVRPGRYEGVVNIPAGANLGQANVVAHLIGADGQETMREATRGVTFGSQEPPAPQYVVGNIEIWNLRGGRTVDRNFFLEGKTVPNSTIHVSAQPQGAAGTPVEVSGTSDREGYFKLWVDATTLPSNTIIDTTISVSDPSGQPLKPVDMTLKIE